MTESQMSVRSPYAPWTKALGEGVRHGQSELVDLEGATSVHRTYQPAIVAGLLQTEAYARAILSEVIAFHGLPDDLDEAVAGRMRRQQVLGRADRQQRIVLTEQALWTRVGGSGVLAAQLDRLAAVAAGEAGEHVRLGVVPRSAPWRYLPMHGFSIFDDAEVHVELLSAAVTVTAPGEVAEYLRGFEVAEGLAVFGEEAVALIGGVKDAIAA